jgi:hypothetical protein
MITGGGGGGAGLTSDFSVGLLGSDFLASDLSGSVSPFKVK